MRSIPDALEHRSHPCRPRGWRRISAPPCHSCLGTADPCAAIVVNRRCRRRGICAWCGLERPDHLRSRIRRSGRLPRRRQRSGRAALGRPRRRGPHHPRLADTGGRRSPCCFTRCGDAPAVHGMWSLPCTSSARVALTGWTGGRRPLSAAVRELSRSNGRRRWPGCTGAHQTARRHWITRVAVGEE